MRSNSPDLFVLESPVNSGVGNNATVMDVLQTFQSSLDKQLTTVNTQFESIGTRIDKLESRQSSLEEEVRASTSLYSSTSSPSHKGLFIKEKMCYTYTFAGTLIGVYLHIKILNIINSFCTEQDTKGALCFR